MARDFLFSYFAQRARCAQFPMGPLGALGAMGAVRVTIGAPRGRCASRASKRMWRRRWSNEQEQLTQEMGRYPKYLNGFHLVCIAIKATYKQIEKDRNVKKKNDEKFALRVLRGQLT